MADLSIMNALAVPSSTPPTMTSLELVDFINASRAAGESTLRHDHFMAKVPLVLGGDAPKFSGTQTYGNNNTRAIYVFPKREACLMAMSYSYDLQAKVFDRMTELEQQAARPMTQLEVIAANAQALVMIERQQQALMAVQQQTSASLAKLEATVAASSVWDHCPQNCEPITKIRGRMLKQYGLPAWVVDMVMRELPLSPKVHGMVRNGHEEAKGMHYEVWAVADVTRTFKRFIDGCTPETAHFASHPDIDRRFHVKAGLLSGGAA